MTFKVGDRVHSFITGHYGYVAGLKPDGEIIVHWPAYYSDNNPASLEPVTPDRTTNSAWGNT